MNRYAAVAPYRQAILNVLMRRRGDGCNAIRRVPPFGPHAYPLGAARGACGARTMSTGSDRVGRVQ